MANVEQILGHIGAEGIQFDVICCVLNDNNNNQYLGYLIADSRNGQYFVGKHEITLYDFMTVTNNNNV